MMSLVLNCREAWSELNWFFVKNCNQDQNGQRSSSASVHTPFKDYNLASLSDSFS